MSRIPVEICKLNKLKEFSTEWFIYLNPPMPKIMREAKGHLIIDQFKQFCRSFIPPNIPHSRALDLKERSFCDFLMYFYQFHNPEDINKVVIYGPKKRGLAH